MNYKNYRFAFTKGTEDIVKQQNDRKNGFTLAEVLITLGIIGIVAAMTLPGLIQNYKKMVLKNQFKKSYSTIQNAYKLAEAQLGYEPGCYYSYDWVGAPCIERDDTGACKKYGEEVNPTNASYDCTTLQNELKEVLNVVKICKKNALKNGCIPAYKGNDTIYKAQHPEVSDYDAELAVSGCGGWKEANIHNNLEVWNLADGTIILWYYPTIFAIDINGMKSPNKWGHDIFTFISRKNRGGLLIFTGGCMPVEDGGVTTSQMLKNVY